MHSIGIEHEGALVDGARWYTEPMYQASARIDAAPGGALPHPAGATPDRVTAMHTTPPAPPHRGRAALRAHRRCRRQTWAVQSRAAVPTGGCSCHPAVGRL